MGGIFQACDENIAVGKLSRVHGVVNMSVECFIDSHAKDDVIMHSNSCFEKPNEDESEGFCCQAPPGPA